MGELPRSDGVVYEVWLLTEDAGALQSLGLTTGRDRFVVPADVDLDRYSIVDVSREPLDGNAAHSGDSLARGPLRDT
jgi:hypothetical protein